MKKNITFILVLTIVVMGTYIAIDVFQHVNNNQKMAQKFDQNNTVTEKQTEDLFAKKQECAKYKEKIEKDSAEELGFMQIDQIFYSPKNNSCVYVKWKQVFVEKIGKYEQRYFLIDALTNETITSYWSESKFGKSKEEFDNLVEEYK